MERKYVADITCSVNELQEAVLHRNYSDMSEQVFNETYSLITNSQEDIFRALAVIKEFNHIITSIDEGKDFETLTTFMATSNKAEYMKAMTERKRYTRSKERLEELYMFFLECNIKTRSDYKPVTVKL